MAGLHLRPFSLNGDCPSHTPGGDVRPHLCLQDWGRLGSDNVGAAAREAAPTLSPLAHGTLTTRELLEHEREMSVGSQEHCLPPHAHARTPCPVRVLALLRERGSPVAQRVSRNWSCSGGFLTQVPSPAFWNALNSCCLTDW